MLVPPHRPPVRRAPRNQPVHPQARAPVLQLPRQHERGRRRVGCALEPRRRLPYTVRRLLPRHARQVRERGVGVAQMQDGSAVHPHVILLLHRPIAT